MLSKVPIQQETLGKINIIFGGLGFDTKNVQAVTIWNNYVNQNYTHIDGSKVLLMEQILFSQFAFLLECLYSTVHCFRFSHFNSIRIKYLFVTHKMNILLIIVYFPCQIELIIASATASCLLWTLILQNSVGKSVFI